MKKVNHKQAILNEKIAMCKQDATGPIAAGTVPPPARCCTTSLAVGAWVNQPQLKCFAR